MTVDNSLDLIQTEVGKKTDRKFSCQESYVFE
jgi:hypothetical protein